MTIPSSVTSIGGGAFFGCKSLEQAGVGEGVTTIPARCFGNCKKLVSIALGSNVSSIDNNAFENCPLEEIYAYPLEAPTSGSCVFTIEKPKVKVYVTNKEAYDKYKASSEWCDFNLQLMSEEMLVGGVTAEGTAVKLFTLNGQRATCNQKGIVVKNGKKYLQK